MVKKIIIGIVVVVWMLSMLDTLIGIGVDAYAALAIVLAIVSAVVIACRNYKKTK
jgi:uncharacterized membrane-anchored protein